MGRGVRSHISEARCGAPGLKSRMSILAKLRGSIPHLKIEMGGTRRTLLAAASAFYNPGEEVLWE
jgi:hypothetical protein